MTTVHRCVAALGLITLVLALGCSGQEATGGPISRQNRAKAASRRLPDVSVAQATPAARRVFQQHFRIDPANSTDTRFVSRPQDVDQVGDPERISDVLTPQRRRDRVIAELIVLPSGGGVEIRCVVERQRLETADRAAFASIRGDDRPDNTAIDRYGTTSVQQREEWVAAGRMRQIENKILAQVYEALATTQPAG